MQKVERLLFTMLVGNYACKILGGPTGVNIRVYIFHVDLMSRLHFEMYAMFRYT